MRLCLLNQMLKLKKRNEKSLVASSGYTRDFLPEEIGTVAMVEEVARVTRKLMEDAGLKDPKDVHFVQIKCPLLTSDRIQDAYDRGVRVLL